MPQEIILSFKAIESGNLSSDKLAKQLNQQRRATQVGEMARRGTIMLSKNYLSIGQATGAERRRSHHGYKVTDNEENQEVKVEEKHDCVVKKSLKHFLKGQFSLQQLKLPSKTSLLQRSKSEQTNVKVNKPSLLDHLLGDVHL